VPNRDFDAIFFVTKAPSVEYKDGLFHICYDIGKHASFEVVMPPKAFVKARLLGSEVLAKWQLHDSTDDTKISRLFRKRK
jgi:hypothetical protein